MSETGADGTQPWPSRGPAPDGGAQRPQASQPDAEAEDTTVVTPARPRPQQPQPDPAAEDPTVVTPARSRPQPPPQPDPAPAEATMDAAAWLAQQQPPTPTPQQPRPYQQPPAPAAQVPNYPPPPAPAQPSPTYPQQPTYEPPYRQPPAQYGQQPAKHAEPLISAALRPKRRLPSTRVLAAGGGVLAAIVLVVLVTGFVAPGFFKTKELNVAAAQAGVQQVLSDKITGYGAAKVDAVTCNNGENPEVKKGATFTCDVRIDGANRQVTATFVNDDGAYEVGPPK